MSGQLTRSLRDTFRPACSTRSRGFGPLPGFTLPDRPTVPAGLFSQVRQKVGGEPRDAQLALEGGLTHAAHRVQAQPGTDGGHQGKMPHSSRRREPQPIPDDAALIEASPQTSAIRQPFHPFTEQIPI